MQIRSGLPGTNSLVQFWAHCCVQVTRPLDLSSSRNGPVGITGPSSTKPCPYLPPLYFQKIFTYSHVSVNVRSLRSWHSVTRREGLHTSRSITPRTKKHFPKMGILMG